jgi:hypothetical protein
MVKYKVCLISLIQHRRHLLTLYKPVSARRSLRVAELRTGIKGTISTAYKLQIMKFPTMITDSVK